MPARLQGLAYTLRTFARYTAYYAVGATYVVVGASLLSSSIPSSLWPTTINVLGQSMAPVLSPHYKDTAAFDQLHILPREELDLYDSEQRGELERARDAFRRAPRGRGKLKLQRGQIVAFRSPRDPDKEVVKRVVALEGDVVVPRQKQWPIWKKTVREGGSPLLQVELVPRRRVVAETPSGCASPWQRARVDGDAETRVARTMQRETEELESIRVTVPFGHVWVEGENVDETLDSSDYGPISKRLILGVATAIHSPAHRRGRVDWTEDGWRERWKGRVEWKYREGKVPQEWDIAL